MGGADAKSGNTGMKVVYTTFDCFGVVFDNSPGAHTGKSGTLVSSRLAAGGVGAAGRCAKSQCVFHVF